MSADQAVIVIESILERMTIVSLEGSEYLNVIRRAAENGILGGTVYDALVAACASKAKAETIYTWNDRHFRLLGAEVALRVANP